MLSKVTFVAALLAEGGMEEMNRWTFWTSCGLLLLLLLDEEG